MFCHETWRNACSVVSPIVLCLFDGTTTTIITEATNLPICFPSGNVTPLDSDCKIVLGHNWLTRYNLSIDWVLSSIKFGTPMQQVPTPSSLPDPVAHSLSTLRLDDMSVSSPSPTDSPQAPGLWAPPITLINAAAFLKACQLDGSQQFSIQLKPDGSFCRSTLLPTSPLSLRLTTTLPMSLARRKHRYSCLIGNTTLR